MRNQTLIAGASLMLMACGGKRTVASTPGADAGLDSHTDQGPDVTVEVGSTLDAGADQDAQEGLPGRAPVNWLGSSPSPLTAGQPIFINFSAESISDLNQVPFQLTADLIGQTNWPVTIVGSNHMPLTPPEVTLNIGQTTLFSVRVDPPAGSSGQQFFVSAATIAGGVTSSSGFLPFTVGASAAQPDPAYQLSLVGDPTLAGGAALVNGDTIIAPVGSSVGLHFEIAFAANATATLTPSVALILGTTGWQTATSLPIISPPPNHVQDFDVEVAPTAAATAGFVSVNLTNNTTQTVQSRVFAVRTN